MIVIFWLLNLYITLQKNLVEIMAFTLKRPSLFAIKIRRNLLYKFDSSEFSELMISQNGTISYTLTDFRTLLLIFYMYKTLCFSFETFRAVKLIQQIAANLNCGRKRRTLIIGTIKSCHRL